MKKILLIFTLLLTSLALTGCISAEKKNKLLTEIIIPTTLKSDMDAKEDFYKLMKENNYQINDISKFELVESDDKEELSFVLKEDITYKQKIKIKPSQLITEIEGPSNKDKIKDIIELTYYTFGENEDGIKVITKEKIQKMIERAKNKKEKQYFEIDSSFKKELKEQGINYESTLKVNYTNNKITIIIKEKIETQKK